MTENTSLREHLQNIERNLDEIYEVFNELKKKYYIKDDLPNRKNENNNTTIKQIPTLKESVFRILEPLDNIFIPDYLKDEIVTKVSIPELLEEIKPNYSGIILFGPPGTGKTAMQKAISEVYRRAGAYSKELSTTSINSSWVSQFAKNLESEVINALQEADKRGKHSLLSFDEGSILTQKAGLAVDTVSKHYQEALDVLKRYIGNDRRLVITISTNVHPDGFEDALIREGRLTSFSIDYPNNEQKSKMWSYFTKKYCGMRLTQEQSYVLSDLISNEHGAFIEEFTRSYFSIRKNNLLLKMGHNNLVSALKNEARVNDVLVRRSINFDTFYDDAKVCL